MKFVLFVLKVLNSLSLIPVSLKSWLQNITPKFKFVIQMGIRPGKWVGLALPRPGHIRA